MKLSKLRQRTENKSQKLSLSPTDGMGGALLYYGLDCRHFLSTNANWSHSFKVKWDVFAGRRGGRCICGILDSFRINRGHARISLEIARRFVTERIKRDGK